MRDSLGGGKFTESPVNGNSRKRSRTTYTAFQTHTLEEMFKKNNFPGRDIIDNLCQTLEISDSRLVNWFKNRRARSRREPKEGSPITETETSCDGETTVEDISPSNSPKYKPPENINPKPVYSHTGNFSINKLIEKDPHLGPDTPEHQLPPRLPNHPSLPFMPIMSDMPVMPNIPVMPNNPGMPNISGMPNNPGMPNISGMPNNPAMSNISGMPNNPAMSNNPVMPNMPRMPNMMPNMPRMPNIHSRPTLPVLPAIPNLPNRMFVHSPQPMRQLHHMTSFLAHTPDRSLTSSLSQVLRSQIDQHVTPDMHVRSLRHLESLQSRPFENGFPPHYGDSQCSDGENPLWDLYFSYRDEIVPVREYFDAIPGVNKNVIRIPDGRTLLVL